MLVLMGGTFGPFALLFLFMVDGLESVALTLFGYLILVLIVYVAELYICDLSEYTEHDESRAIKKSKRNVLFVFVVILLGTIFYVFDM